MPPNCAICESDSSVFCISCKEKFSFSLQKNKIGNYDHFFLSSYTHEYKKLFHSIKYNNNKLLLNEFANLLKNNIKNSIFYNFDYVIFVPYHRSRLNSRGFDVVKILFSFLEINFNLKYLPIISRKKSTKKLALISKYDRYKLMDNAFEVNSFKFKPYSSILIVDDIVTTQATMKSIIYKLEKLPNVARISCLSIIRV